MCWRSIFSSDLSLSIRRLRQQASQSTRPSAGRRSSRRDRLTAESLETRLLMAGDASTTLAALASSCDSPTAESAPAASTTNVASYSLAAAAVSDDRFEPNNTRATAANLGTVSTTQTIGNLVAADSYDWYRFSTTSNGRTGQSVSLAFDHSLGDLDLRLYSSTGRLLATSDGVTNSEQISLARLPAGTYFVRVNGYRGATNPNYSLTLNLGNSTPGGTGTGTGTGAGTGTGGTGTGGTGTGGSTSGFDIQFNFSGLTASQQSIFAQAAQRWESIITGDLPNATYQGRIVDDLLIEARATSIDGRGGVLGQAAPDRFRSGSQLPYHGMMEFDSSDLASMESNGTLLGVVLHEMGHVLGIGTLWASKGLLAGAGTSNPRFTGRQATAAYNAIFGQNATGVPVEGSGGSGTRDAHWSESILGNEIMTGYVGPGSNMPISRITVGSLADIGYTVNLSSADAYARPGASSVAAAQIATTGINASLATASAGSSTRTSNSRAGSSSDLAATPDVASTSDVAAAWQAHPSSAAWSRPWSARRSLGAGAVDAWFGFNG